MKTKFIKINDISDVDPSKTTVYDLNTRYIDSRGNMYSLKYNRNERKIEIVRIIRTPANSAPFYEQKIRESKKTLQYASADTNTSSDNLDESEGELTDGIEDSIDEYEFEPDTFINETLESMKTHKERLSVIIANIDNPQILSVINEGENDLESIFRNIEIDGIMRIDKVFNLHKEIASYPRSATHYLAKLDNKDKNFAESLDNEKQQMKYIFLNEMSHSIRNLYRTLKKIINDVQIYFKDINTKDMTNLTHLDKQNIDDAKTSIDNTVSEINRILDRTKLLEEYISIPDNF